MKIKSTVDMTRIGFGTKEEVADWLNDIVEARYSEMDLLQKRRIMQNKARKQRAKDKLAKHEKQKDKFYALIESDTTKLITSTTNLVALGSKIASHVTIRGYINELVDDGKLKYSRVHKGYAVVSRLSE